MKTYPLKSLSIDKAQQMQFLLVDKITRHFSGSEILARGDLGLVSGLNRPLTTKKVEDVLADFFDAKSCLLVRGAGTNALRLALYAATSASKKILVHKAPVYPTTLVSFQMLGLEAVYADFHSEEEVAHALASCDISAALVQVTRQKADDRYDTGDVIKMIKKLAPHVFVVTDDNYAVLKVPKIGTQLGGDLACFSSFKLLGPEGIGCIVGNDKLIERLRKEQYSGGTQVQGHEALEVLYGMIYAPVALAVSASVSETVCNRLNAGEIPEVSRAFVANSQSKVVIVQFKEEIAEAVLAEAEKLGAAPRPVGAESKYEFVPMFYRLSGTFRAADKTSEKTMIRINPMRAGADTVLRIICEAVQNISR